MTDNATLQAECDALFDDLTSTLERVVALESQVENLSTLHRLEQERAVRAEARVARLTAPATVAEGIAVAETYLCSGRPMSAILDEFIAARKERAI